MSVHVLLLLAFVAIGGCMLQLSTCCHCTHPSSNCNWRRARHVVTCACCVFLCLSSVVSRLLGARLNCRHWDQWCAWLLVGRSFILAGCRLYCWARHATVGLFKHALWAWVWQPNIRSSGRARLSTLWSPVNQCVCLCVPQVWAGQCCAVLWALRAPAPLSVVLLDDLA